MFSEKSKSAEYKTRAVGIKYGYLVKQGLKLKTWKKRWFVMNYDQLSYYETPQDATPLGSFSTKDIVSVVAASESETSRSHCLKVVTAGRTYFFSPEEKKDFDEWLIALRSLSNLHPSRNIIALEQMPQLSKVLSIFESVSKLIPACNQIALGCKDLSRQKDIADRIVKIGSNCISLSNATFATVSKISSSKNWQTGASFTTMIQMLEQLRLDSESVMLLIVGANVPSSGEVVKILHDCSQSIEVATKVFDVKSSDEAAKRVSVYPEPGKQPTSGQATKDADTSNQPVAALQPAVQTRNSHVHQSVAFARGADIASSLNELFSLCGELDDAVGILLKEIQSKSSPPELLSSCKIVVSHLTKINGHADSVMKTVLPDLLRYVFLDSIQAFQEAIVGLIHSVRAIAMCTGDHPSIANLQESAFANYTRTLRDLVSAIRTLYEYMEGTRISNDLLQSISVTKARLGSALPKYSALLALGTTLIQNLSTIPTHVLCHHSAAEDPSFETDFIQFMSDWSEDLKKIHHLCHGFVDDLQKTEATDILGDVKDMISIGQTLLLSLKTVNSDLLSRIGIYQLLHESKNFATSLTQIIVQLKDAAKAAGLMEADDDENDADGASGEKDINIWDETKDSSENIIFGKEEGDEHEKIKAATLNKLVQRLTSDAISDVKFRNVFITTYRSFTTPEKLFKKLVQRFHVPKTKLPPNVDAEEYAKKFVLPIQTRVLNVMKNWIEVCHHDINEALMKEIGFFITNTKSVDGQNMAARMLQGPFQKIAAIKKPKASNIKPSSVATEASPQQVAIASSLIMSSNSEAIAKELTRIDFDIFKSIQTVELLNNCWNHPKLQHRAPHVLRMIARFNHVSEFIASSILAYTTLKERIRIYTKFIEIAVALKKLNNFNMLLAIISGLRSVPIDRLKHTKAGISKAAAQELESLEATVSSKKSYQSLRDAIRQANPPCTPFLGMYLTDLVFIEQGNPDSLNSLINFRKRELVYNVIQDVKQYQQSSYAIPPEHGLTATLSELPRVTTNLYDVSLAVEPRNAPLASLK